MEGRDIVGIAETGSGKTLAYLLPAIFHAQKKKSSVVKSPVVLCIMPTRELVLQVQEECSEFIKLLGRSRWSLIWAGVIYGGDPRRKQICELAFSPPIIIATLGRLKDFVLNGIVSLERISFVVLDEADQILERNFEEDLRTVCNEIPSTRQTMMFSATWPSCMEQISSYLFTAAERIRIVIGKEKDEEEDSAFVICKDIKQELMFIEGEGFGSEVKVDENALFQLAECWKRLEHKERMLEWEDLPRLHALLHLIFCSQKRFSQDFKMIIFANTKARADSLTSDLYYSGCEVECVHSGKRQETRENVFKRFRHSQDTNVSLQFFSFLRLQILQFIILLNMPPPGIEPASSGSSP